MADLLTVTVSNRGKQLLDDYSSVSFLKTLPLNDLIEQLSTLTVLRHKIDMFLFLEGFVKFKDIRMIKVLKDVDLILKPHFLSR